MNNINGFFYIKFKNFTLNTTFSFNKRKIIAIIGESGSGKTTFLKCISGIIKPKNSFFCINKKIIQNSKKNIFTEINKRKIGYIFQVPSLFTHMSVSKNITFGFKKKKRAYVCKSTLIKILNLEKLKHRKIYNLSTGEKQRIMITQIILTQPQLILLDEAFSSQDINMKKKLISIFKNINNKFNIPIICVSHDIKYIKDFADSIFYLNNGKLIYQNTTSKQHN